MKTLLVIELILLVMAAPIQADLTQDDLRSIE